MLKSQAREKKRSFKVELNKTFPSNPQTSIQTILKNPGLKYVHKTNRTGLTLGAVRKVCL